jgi:8-oxo-dGTP diphosphatase
MLFFPRESHEDGRLVAIATRYKGKWLYVRHAGRKSFRLPSCYASEGESHADAADRALREETGAQDYGVWPVSPFGLLQGGQAVYGHLFFASIVCLGELPAMGVAERCTLDEPPDEPDTANMRRQLLDRAEKWLVSNQTRLYCISAADVGKARLVKLMGGFHIDGVFTGPDRQTQAHMAALAGDRGLRLEQREELGEAMEDALASQGTAAAAAVAEAATMAATAAHQSSATAAHQGSATETRQGMAAAEVAAAAAATVAFQGLLTKEKGRSIAVGLTSKALEAIIQIHKGWLAPDEDALYEKYATPGELRSMGGGGASARRTALAVCLEYVGDTLVGFWEL